MLCKPIIVECFSCDAYDSTSDRLDQNSATLSVCRYCCQSVSELCLTLAITHTLQPRTPDTISYLDKWKPRGPPPSPKVWKPRPEPPPLRTNQKSYLEGRGRFEHIPSKVLLQKSATTPLSREKASLVPKLTKARRTDVFIPSTLSVATLAKLLNVKLGT